ncbi:ATP-binding protein [Fodinisporobacter ferrooxydans]|uniref:ATP-binding protein n=1 Tax=Fodinisporobacter ferrooxydans TaxID=2901836 RepID=A0ABY4CHE1_9BACL|nr:ATP-binding protein [Alicyclobacillaceae bacterium MYW30-H2]
MTQQIFIRSENDIFYVLSKIRTLLQELQPSDMERQKVLVSVSELAHNILDHADGKGYIQCERIGSEILIEAADSGPGLQNAESSCMRKTSISRRGLGKGLAGVHRLMDEVLVETSERGTRIIATKRIQSRSAK